MYTEMEDVQLHRLSAVLPMRLYSQSSACMLVTLLMIQLFAAVIK